MSEQLREALSAIVDGEASNFELRRVLDEISKDESLQTTWHNYHLMRSAMHGENTVNVSGMSDRIWAELDFEAVVDNEAEPTITVEEQAAEPPRRRWGVALGSGAIAAAVATVLLVSGNLPGTGDAGAPSQIAQETTSEQTSEQRDGFAVQTGDYEVTVADAVQAVNVGVTTEGVADTDIDYGPGFVRLADMTPQQRAYTDGRVMRHIQQRGMNHSNLLSFTKMVTYQQ